MEILYYKHRVDEVEQAKNRTKSTVRSKVEHVFADEAEVRICEAALPRVEEKCQPAVSVCALVNLYLVRKTLLLLAPASSGSEGLLIRVELPKRVGDQGKNESER